MKTKLYSLATMLLYANLLFSQADLVVSAAGFQPNSIAKGDIFQVQATVTNVGTTTAGANYLFIYYTQDLTVTPEEIISRVSIKSLAPNESQEVEFLYPVPTTIGAGNYYLAFDVDPFDDVAESDEDNLFCSGNSTGCVTFNITNSIVYTQKFNYPVIFIHGWTGSSTTWNEFTAEAKKQFGWSYGGRLDYCLNPDGSQYTSDGYINSFVNFSSLNVGDYYLVNFDVATDGQLYVGNDGIPFNDDYSNQSAIVKQGWAVGDAVEKVLDKTGAEKVILVGHSMGGLAAREYLQNSSNWQPDGEHHVAKLLTIGTPNGGSNETGLGIGTFVGYDESSEAVRDLRYFSLLFDGQFLDGGLENVFSLFYNGDVNCNGFTGDNITGLNDKTAPADVNYSCIVGVGNNLPSLSGDGIVEAYRADLNNYLLAQPPLGSLHAERLNVSTWHLSIHQENHDILVRSLDEPDDYHLAYPIPLNSFNFGFITEQVPNSFYPDVDYDDYQLEITANGLLEVNVYNIPVHEFGLFLLDEDYNVLEEIYTEGQSNAVFTRQMTPGTYFLEAAGIPTPNSWRFPYASEVNFTPVVLPVANFNANVQSGCGPMTVQFSSASSGNPSSHQWSFPGGTPAVSTAVSPSVIYASTGVYPVTLTVSNASGSNTVTKDGYITVKEKPQADFSFSTSDLTVDFTNLTQFAGDTPTYLWDFGDGQVSTAPSPSHTYPISGVYPVKLTSSNSCGNTFKTLNVDVTIVSNSDLLRQAGISVYPNPAGDFVMLKIEREFTGRYEILLLNGMGQLIRQNEMVKAGSVAEFRIDLTDLPKGAYFIQIESEQENFVGKIARN